MKNLYTITVLLFTATVAHTQVFWTDDFGTGCNRGTLATAYTDPNGQWTMTSLIPAETYANSWFVSSTCSGTGAGNCASNCITSSVTNASLHVSNVTIITPQFIIAADSGATYFSGGLCGLGYCAVTDRRIESPAINCSAKSNISVSFVYLENGDGPFDDASLEYSADGGTTWTTIDALAKTPTTCAAAGQWTAITVALPASADNNANVKIGFRWANNDDGQGTDPSFAVDDITLGQNVTGMNTISQASQIDIFSTTDGTININTNGQAYKVTGVHNVLGQNAEFTQSDNSLVLQEPSSGIYIVAIEVNGVRIVRKVFVN
ncbi:MAG TPA: hypothetical protein VK826_01600 [Bacteroidia bacterium]|nr:hypothetical protein [Bacteroidia bacterium]